MNAYKRSERVAELIQHEISKIIQELKNSELGFVTITGVKVTDDLKSAVVFYSVMGSEEEIKKNIRIMKDSTAKIRYELAQKVNLRRAPALIMEYDDTAVKATRVFELLEKVKKEEEDNNA
jgi:ribosome-binding factor A